MNRYKVEIFVKGGRLAVSYNADATSAKYVIDVTLTSIEKHPWITYHQDDEMAISIRVSEIESVKVIPV